MPRRAGGGAMTPGGGAPIPGGRIGGAMPSGGGMPIAIIGGGGIPGGIIGAMPGGGGIIPGGGGIIGRGTTGGGGSDADAAGAGAGAPTGGGGKLTGATCEPEEQQWSVRACLHVSEGLHTTYNAGATVLKESLGMSTPAPVPCSVVEQNRLSARGNPNSPLEQGQPVAAAAAA